MSKHTPGPWVIDWNVSRLDIFSADASTLVATLRRSVLSPGIDDAARANARLIASAPELAKEIDALRAERDRHTALMRQALQALEGLFGVPDEFTGSGGGGVAVWREDGLAPVHAAIITLREALKVERDALHRNDCALVLGGYQCTCGFNQRDKP